VLVGALEIVPPRPVLSSIVPASSPDAGGATLTLGGRHFRSGARVLIGERIYVDGALGGCTVLDENTIQLTTVATPGGVWDVVVIDDSGLEGRIDDGFVFASVPAVDSLFPTVGATLGGTRVTLHGSGFAQGAEVRIDGVAQLNIDVLSAAQMSFDTAPGDPGGPYVVEVENPGGALATAAFAFAPQQDPELDAISPAVVPAAGAVWVSLHGDGFTSDAQVRFGADPHSGMGGIPSAEVIWVDSQLLSALVPAHAAGVVSVMVLDGSSGQAALLPEGLSYRSSGGSGGCASTLGAGGGTLRGALEGSGWLLPALLCAWYASRPRRRVQTAR
jgi:hypothetical protein